MHTQESEMTHFPKQALQRPVGDGKGPRLLILWSLEEQTFLLCLFLFEMEIKEYLYITDALEYAFHKEHMSRYS